MMGSCQMGHGMCMMHGGMNKRIIIYKDGNECEGEKEGKCCQGETGECHEKCCEGDEKMDCCKKAAAKCDMKMEVKKDTVVVKKK